MNKLNDQHYINLVISGNTNAFATLVDRYKHLVFTLAFKMVKNREEAEEIAQDTFIKVYKSLPKFKGESKFSTWIYRVTYNACLDKLKAFKREQPIIIIDAYIENQIKSLDNTLDAIENEERRKMIQDSLNLLPSEDSFLLTLFYFEDQSLEEISKIMGITPNNAKVKLFRSRKKLTSILKERLEPEIIEYYESERR